jgi:hypothetical protein
VRLRTLLQTIQVCFIIPLYARCWLRFTEFIANVQHSLFLFLGEPDPTPSAGDNPQQGMENAAAHHLMHRFARNIATLMHRVLSNGQAQRPTQPQPPLDATPSMDAPMNAEQPTASSSRGGSTETQPNPPVEASGKQLYSS